jgi:ribonuclease HI
MFYYAVRYGRNPGIYTSWEICKKQVIGFKGAVYKKFNNAEKANTFVQNTSKSYFKAFTKSAKSEQDIKSGMKTSAPIIIHSSLRKTKQKPKLTLQKKDNTIYIFTDGSSLSNGTKTSKSGYGIYIPGPSQYKSKISVKLPLGSTNNHAELTAILESLRLFDYKKTTHKIVIITDSQYSINCITKWYENWVRKGWLNSKNDEVKNKELIKAIYPLYKKYDVSFVHINSHTSHKGFFYEGNEIADKLANSDV